MIIKNKEKILNFYSNYMYLIGIAGQLLFVFQTIRIVLNHSSGDVSLTGFLISFVSLASWLFYGILKEDRVLVVVNIAGVIAAASCIAAILIFK